MTFINACGDVKYILYADDTTVFVFGSNLNDLMIRASTLFSSLLYGFVLIC